MATSKVKRMSWKLVGSASGTNPISLPNDWGEALAVLNLYGGVHVYSICMVNDGNANDQYYRGGFYASSSNYTGVVVKRAGNVVSGNDFYLNGSQTINDASLTLYYK